MSSRTWTGNRWYPRPTKRASARRRRGRWTKGVSANRAEGNTHVLAATTPYDSFLGRKVDPESVFVVRGRCCRALILRFTGPLFVLLHPRVPCAAGMRNTVRQSRILEAYLGMRSTKLREDRRSEPRWMRSEGGVLMLRHETGVTPILTRKSISRGSSLCQPKEATVRPRPQ